MSSSALSAWKTTVAPLASQLHRECERQATSLQNFHSRYPIPPVEEGKVTNLGEVDVHGNVPGKQNISPSVQKRLNYLLVPGSHIFPLS